MFFHDYGNEENKIKLSNISIERKMAVEKIVKKDHKLKRQNDRRNAGIKFCILSLLPVYRVVLLTWVCLIVGDLFVVTRVAI